MRGQGSYNDSGGSYIYKRTDCWASDISAGFMARDITVAVGAQIYTLVVMVQISILGVGRGPLLWLWGHTHIHCWGSDINAGCGGRGITAVVGAQICTLIVGAVTSTLGVGAGA